MPYIPAVNRLVLCALAALAATQARADGIAIVGGSPRAIGRAGAAVVGDDGGGALLINPAAMARRDTWRIEAGAAMVDDDVRWQTDAGGAPLTRGQAGSRLMPLAAVIGAVGDWVVGAGAMTAAISERSLARPRDVRADLGASFDYRYTGIAGGYRRDTLALGIARRIGDSLALGLSIGASQLNVTEHRRIWAGFAGRAQMIGEPTSDVDVVLTGTDRMSESAVLGLLYAPENTPIELGASVGWARTVALEGTIEAVGNPPDGPSIVEASPLRAQLTVQQPLSVRAGGRYIGDRIVLELDGDLWIAPRGTASTSWSVQGVRIVDPSGVGVYLRRVPSRISQHTHVAMRTALDVELIPGFLWATCGYALATPGMPASRLSPTFGDLGGQTLGLGLETTAGGLTVTLGWSRTWAVSIAAPTELSLDNPFMAGDGPVPSGTYDGSLDQIGVLLELELGHR
jgi:hypothetical protein